MQVVPFLHLPQFVEGDDIVKYLDALRVSLADAYIFQAQALAGNLGFGDETDRDNILGEWKTYSTNAIANTEDTIAHSLGVVPVGFLLIKPTVSSGTIHLGSTSWTTSNIFLQCTEANKTATLFILAPSQGILV